MTQRDLERLVVATRAALLTALHDEVALLCETRPELDFQAIMKNVALRTLHDSRPGNSDAARKLRQMTPWELPAASVASYAHENLCIRLLDLLADSRTVHVFGLPDKLAAAFSKFFLDNGIKICWPAEGALIGHRDLPPEAELRECRTIVQWYGKPAQFKLDDHPGYYALGKGR